MHLTRIVALTGSLTIAVAAGSAWADAQPGWTLFSYTNSDTFRLIDLDGNVAHSWTGEFNPGLSIHLIESGGLLVSARDDSVGGPTGIGRGGRVQRLNWDGAVEWEAVVATDTIRQHHDIAPMPNGNVLCLVFDLRTREEAIAAGRDPVLVDDEILSEGIVEIDGVTGEIVWEWYAFDHLVQDFDVSLPNYGDPADHPERIDINFAPSGDDRDWLHANAIAYNPTLDQIIISNREWSEFWIISHDSADAGDLVYRWGNPQTYGRGTAADQRLFGQHSVHWIEDGLPGAGNVLLYNNRSGGANSSVDELVTPVLPDGTYQLDVGDAYGPPTAFWSCDNAGGVQFFSPVTSSAQRLENGNTLIGVGQGASMYEVDDACELQWSHIAGGGTIFRAERIGEDDPRLDGFLFCRADLDGSGAIDFDDVVSLLAEWGRCLDCPVDLDDSGAVDFLDLIALLAQWGPCPG